MFYQLELWEILFDFSYIVYDLPVDSHYMMSVNISVCYDPSHCVLTENILDNMMLPKSSCDFKTTRYDIPGMTSNLGIYIQKIF